MRTPVIVLLLTFLPAGSMKAYGGKQESEFIARLKKVHSNIYQVFEYREEEDIYRCLSRSFADEELDDQFFEFLKTIREFEALGNKNIIEQIDYEDIAVESARKDRVRVRMMWKVHGLVRHQLHEHRRINTYEAMYELRRTGEDDWRIVHTLILTSERIIFPKIFFSTD